MINSSEEILQSLLAFFAFDPSRPLVFTDRIFWFFLAGVLVVDMFVHKRRGLRHAFLFVASLFFYYKTTGLFFLLLLLTCIWDFLIGKKIFVTRNPIKRKWWLVASIAMNLGVLCYFKYAYFFTDLFNQTFGTSHAVFNHLAYWSNGFFGTGFDIDKIILPIGISFFTFQSISYTVEVYKGELKPVKRFTDFAFFVTFFPQLVAGPIVRSTDLIPQLYKTYHLTKHEWGLAIFWILNGLLKKLVLADYMAVQFIDRVFSHPDAYTGFENLMAIFAYSLQVYADFSGYTDIAIGVALLMGFHFTKNFNSPYKASSVADFWRRWHMSLSHWLRDYLYIPLGGNQGGGIGSFVLTALFIGLFTAMSGSWLVLSYSAALILIVLLVSQVYPAFRLSIQTNINLMLTMLIGGLWHGASWNFLIWGGLNGLALVFYKYWNHISPWRDKSRWYNQVWGILLTFSFITFTRVWFRAGSNTGWSDLNETHDIAGEFMAATGMLQRIFLHMDFTIAPSVLWAYGEVFLLFALGMIIHWLPERWKNSYRNRFAALPYPAIGLICVGSILLMYQFSTAGLHPFIYFQF
jgi:alginate O-acetyltransferase complex protein AlgI